MNKDQREIQRKLRILKHAEDIGSVVKTCRYFGIGRSSFYRWREVYAKHGETGLINRPSIPKQHYNRTPLEIEEKVLYLRRKYHLGPIRIVWYLQRYHDINIASIVVDNTLGRQFDVDAPDTVWVTDITYIKTYEGFAYLAVVIDLYSRRVVGWSMQNRQPTELVLQALLTVVWRRKPKNTVLVHSDQGTQFTSIDWALFLKHHNLEHSMSRRGNCHDNAVTESFFNLLKRERIRRRTYKTRDDARKDVFDYIEMFYNTIRKHARNGMLSPVKFEEQQKTKTEGV